MRLGSTGYSRTSLVAGVFFILAGVVFLLDELEVWGLQAAYIWPLLLIGLGVAVIFGGRSS